MSFNSCKISDYSRIIPTRGTGYILTNLADFGPSTKRRVYENSITYPHGWRPGFHSSIWAKLLEDGLIASDGGCREVRNWDGQYYSMRAFGKHRAPIYHLTRKGREVMEAMFKRLYEK